jgi:hypothetical protein
MRNSGSSETALQSVIHDCEEHLRPFGFTRTTRSTLWRQTPVKFDLLNFDLIPRSRQQKWHVPPGSFLIEPSCLFPSLPRLGGITNQILVPGKGFGQIRLSVWPRNLPVPARSPNVWWVDLATDAYTAAKASVLSALVSTIVPFFAQFEDLSELIRTLQEDEDAIGGEGVWDFGKKGSPRRLIYLGFAAIESEQWELASSSFRECEKRLASLADVVRALVEPNILPHLTLGMDLALRRQRWDFKLHVL